MGRSYALIIDDDLTVAEQTQHLLEKNYNFKVIVSAEVKNAIENFKSCDDTALIIISNKYESEITNLDKLFSLIKKKNRDTPVFVTGKSTLSRSYEEILEIIKTDNLIEDIDSIIKKYFQIDGFTPPKEYTTISVVPLRSIGTLQDDIYIKFKTGHYIKLFNMGDEINETEISKYMDKGLKEFFLHKKTYKWSFNKHYCDELESKAKSEKTSKQEVSPKQDNEVRHTKPDISGPFKMERKYAEEFHIMSDKIMNSMQKDKNLLKYLKLLSKKSDETSFLKLRTGLVCNIITEIAKKMNWLTVGSFEKIVYIAYMHDIALFAHPKLAEYQFINELDDLSKNDRDLIFSHPLKSVEIIQLDKRAPADVESIILQHHELPNGTGFPRNLNQRRIVSFAAALSISINFSQYIMKNENWDIFEYILRAKKIFRGGAFTKILRALEDIADGK